MSDPILPAFWIDPHASSTRNWHAVLGAENPHNKKVYTACGIAVQFVVGLSSWDLGHEGPNNLRRHSTICVDCLEKLASMADLKWGS